eukprot:8425918-Lingulodinium_polyedra.AAC.1
MEVWINHIVASATGTVCASLLVPTRCHCHCPERGTSEPVLELLREQLHRCGPERLAGAPSPASRSGPQR